MNAQRRPMKRRTLRQAGFSLIEVLVVLVLFSIGLLGLVAMQARATQVSVSAEDTTRAALLANELASAMWGANSVTLASGVIDTWNTRVANASERGVPNGVGTVVVAANVATITVTWRAPHEVASAQHRYVTQVLIP